MEFSQIFQFVLKDELNNGNQEDNSNSDSQTDTSTNLNQTRATNIASDSLDGSRNKKNLKIKKFTIPKKSVNTSTRGIFLLLFSQISSTFLNDFVLNITFL